MIFIEEMSATTEVKDKQKSKLVIGQESAKENKNRMSNTKENRLETLGEKEKHKFNTGCSLFPIHMWLYFLYIALAVILPIFGTLLIICGNYGNTGYFSLFAILNYPFPGLKVEDPNYTASSLEVLQVRFGFRPRSPPAHLLDLRLLLLVVHHLPSLRHHRLSQADVDGPALAEGGMGRCEDRR